MGEQIKLSLNFPKKFLWGASISTHQVEGGNHNQWTTWELETAQEKVAQASYNYEHLPLWNEIKKEALKPENYVSGKSADHFNLYKHDFDIAQRLNFSVLRSGIEWSRIEPEEGEFDPLAVAHYKKYFTEMKKRGIEPVITLWHWTFPDWFAGKGGFAKRRNIKYFTRYVEYVTEQLGMHFNYVITLNEPTVYAAMSYHERRWPPEEGSKFLMLKVMRNLAKAHKKSYKIIKRMRPQAQVGLAHNCAYYYAGDDSVVSKIVARLGHAFSNEYFINRLRKQQDFFGLNYYFANRVCGTRVHNSNQRRNDLGWDMQPDKMGPLIEQLYAKYKLPLLITESGVADMHDTYRKWWIIESVKAMNTAITNNVPIIGYIHWSLLDNFEWAEGFWPRFGLIEVDYKTMKRRPRPSALWYGKLIKTLKSN
jgi:beta-glucosidase